MCSQGARVQTVYHVIRIHTQIVPIGNEKSSRPSERVNTGCIHEEDWKSRRCTLSDLARARLSNLETYYCCVYFDVHFTLGAVGRVTGA